MENLLRSIKDYIFTESLNNEVTYRKLYFVLCFGVERHQSEKYFFLLFFVIVFTNANAQTWSTVGTGIPNSNGRIDAMCVYNGELYAAGLFYNIGAVNVTCIARWNGITWDSVPGAFQFNQIEIFSMVVYNNELIVGGTLCASSQGCPCIAAWNGSTWNFLGSGIDNRILGLAVYNNELYATGQFQSAGGIPTRGIAKWNGIAWDSVGGAGLDQSSGFTGNSFQSYNGELYLAGNFIEVCGLPAHQIAKWNGTVWDSVGIINNGGAYSLCEYNNKLYAAGYLSYNTDPNLRYINRWDNLSWDSVGFNLNRTPRCMATYNNELYAGGDFDSTGNQPVLGIARWNDSQWNSVGSGLDLFYINQDTVILSDTNYYPREHIYSMCTYNNELYVGGIFSKIGGINANCIAKWHVVGASVNEQSPNNFSVQVIPNPLNQNGIFQLTGLNGNKTLIIYDQLGKEIWRKETSKNIIEFSAESFATGLYFYRIEEKGGSNAVGKFIIQ